MNALYQNNMNTNRWAGHVTNVYVKSRLFEGSQRIFDLHARKRSSMSLTRCLCYREQLC